MHKRYSNKTMLTIKTKLYHTITRSHGSVTNVVRATRQVNGRRQIYPSPHPHPLTDSHEILHTWLRPPYLPTSRIWSRSPQGVTSPNIAKVTTQFFLFLSVYAKSFYRPRAQAVEPILTRETPTDAFWGLEDNIFTSSPSKPPKNSFLDTYNGKPMENTCA